MTKKEAMEYILYQQKGYVKDIVQAIGEENFKALCLLGFIKRGKEVNNKDSWKATKFLKQFLEPYNEKISFFDKVRYYINSKIG